MRTVSNKCPGGAPTPRGRTQEVSPVSTTKSSSRRVKSRFACVYYRDTPQGRAYEITFRDHNRKQRWERVPGFDNIEAARDLLADRQGKRRRGERVAPAGITFSDIRSRYQQSSQFDRLGAWTRKSYKAYL